MAKKKILVSGATGTQGGAVVEALLAGGHEVIGLVRDPASDKAKGLQAKGVELRQGSFGDEASLVAAMEGVDAVFGLTTPYAGDSEVEQGTTFVNAASKAQVPHVVFSSVGSADRATGIPHFDSKYEVEKLLSASGLSWTVTAPVFFMENFLFPWNTAALKSGIVRQAFGASTKLQMVSVRDIGRFNALALTQPERFKNQRIDYAGDSLTGNEIATILGQSIGKEVGFQEQPIEEVRGQSEDLALMFEWFEKTGYSADIPELEKDYPSVEWSDFSTWAKGISWEQVLAD